MLQLGIYLALTAFLLGGSTLIMLYTSVGKKLVGSLVLATVLVLSVITMSQSMGKAIPTWASFLHKPIRVLAIDFEEGKGIYVWGKTESGEYVSYVLPWVEEEAKDTAKQIQEQSMDNLFYDSNAQETEEQSGFKFRQETK